MGTYIDATGVILHQGDQVYDLLDVANGSDVSGNTTLLKAISTADSIINDHLRPRYSLPLESVPDSLESIASEIVRYKLVQRRQEVVNDEDRRVYEDALSMLKGYRDGKNTLEFPAQAETSDRATAEVVEVGSSDQHSQHLSSQPWFKNF